MKRTNFFLVSLGILLMALPSWAQIDANPAITEMTITPTAPLTTFPYRFTMTVTLGLKPDHPDGILATPLAADRLQFRLCPNKMVIESASGTATSVFDDLPPDANGCRRIVQKSTVDIAPNQLVSYALVCRSTTVYNYPDFVTDIGASVTAISPASTTATDDPSDNIKSVYTTAYIAPTVPDLLPIVYARPTVMYGQQPFTLVADVIELNNIASSGLITVKLNKDSKISSYTLDNSATSVGGRSVQNSQWSMDSTTDPAYVVMTSSAAVAAGDRLSFGLACTLTPGATTGTLTTSAVLVGGSGGETNATNNSDADKVEYFQQ